LGKVKERWIVEKEGNLGKRRKVKKNKIRQKGVMASGGGECENPQPSYF